MSALSPTEPQDGPASLPENVFHGVIWALLGICLVSFGLRAYIRYVCFHRLLWEDWMMLFALLIMIAMVVLSQIFLVHIYALMDVTSGKAMPGPTFFDDTMAGLRAFGTIQYMFYVGVWTIKLSFMVFFRRLGKNITFYYAMWWIFLVVIIGCVIPEIVLISSERVCLFGTMEDLITTCRKQELMDEVFRYAKVSCALDVFSDALIMFFPIAILWRIRASMRQKIFLSGMFSLVAFTIAITIVRGTTFAGLYKPDASAQKKSNIAWIWFWDSLEYMVAFLVACLVSFRSIFSQKKRRENIQVEAQLRRQRPATRNQENGLGGMLREFHETILETCHTLEGREDDHSGNGRLNSAGGKGDSCSEVGGTESSSRRPLPISEHWSLPKPVEKTVSRGDSSV